MILYIEKRKDSTQKLPEINVGKTLFDIIHSNIFFHLSPKAKETKEKNEI